MITLNMISFIIIGRNEGWRLTKCLKSVYNTINANELKNYEVIYVDSKSSDDSIERAQEFNGVNIFQLTRDFNAAIARNIGAKESKGDVLFFIDGDMEIQEDFLPLVYEQNKGLIYPFVSGELENYYYNKNGDLLYKSNRCNFNKDVFQTTTGGFFLIKKDLWVSVGGMKTKLKKSQDVDLGFRLSKKGIKLLRKKEVLAKHNTISYNDPSRMWKEMFNGSYFYRSILLREHFVNLQFQRKFLRENYSSICLILTFGFLLFFPNIFVIIPYFIVIFIRAWRNMINDTFRIPSRLLFLLIRDSSLWLVLFFFWPKEINDIEYREII